MASFPDKVRWFAWGSTLAVVDDRDGRAFSIGADGWREVNSADLDDGDPLSEAEARAGFPRMLAKFSDPPIASAQEASSLARAAAQ